MSGCRPVQEVSNNAHNEVKQEIIYRDRILKDTVALRDSVFVFQKGDTIRETIYREKYIQKTIRDTFFIFKRDTLRITEQKVITLQPTLLEKIAGGAKFWLIAIVAAFVFALWLKSR